MVDHVKTSKQLSALRQVRAAIEHFHKGEFECAMTLAAAGEGQLSDKGIKFFWRILKLRAPAEDFNLFINWLKHATGPDKAIISEFEVVLTIARAIHKFVAAYSKSCAEFEAFSKWAVEHGHMPTRLTQKQE
jgi:hypothetical protein